MEIIINKDITSNYEKASNREWLETNGLGGWSSSTICGSNTRGYHGILVAAIKPPVERMVLVSKLDETIHYQGNSFELNANEFKGAITDAGLSYFNKFTKTLLPSFYYQNAGLELKKSVCMLHGENTVIVTYEVIHAASSFEMHLNPLFSCKDYHSLIQKNDGISQEATFGKNILKVKPYSHSPEVYIHAPDASFQMKPEWYLNFEYRVELERGLNAHEDLFSYGKLVIELNKGDKYHIILTTENKKYENPEQLIETELERREKLIENIPVKNTLTKSLALAADQFIVSRGNGQKTIIAGYHWFGDWGRDTMIALPGLCLVTKRFEEAKEILLTFAKYMDKGIIPNRFPDHDEQPEYNTVDATLWYFVAIKRYYDYTKDLDLIKELYDKLKESIEWHYKGTHYDIHVESDGLLFAGEYGVQLTWMDAKVGTWVVTPRMGKPVEINALWYNALAILSEFAGLLQLQEDQNYYQKKSEEVKAIFVESYKIQGKNYLYDYINIYEKNDDLRPNQLIAISLPYELLTKEEALGVLKACEEYLLTPYGMRTLNQDHFKYESYYTGNSWSRDGAYHQGTVWPWLLGPFISAKIKLEGTKGKQEVERYLMQFQRHLTDAGVGSVSEIFDGDLPHLSKGCISQAWSVAEILRVCNEDL